MFSQLGEWMGQIRTILRCYDASLKGSTAPEEVAVRLSRTQREGIDLRAVLAAAAWLEEHWPAPSERIEAVFALWELGLSVS